MGLNEAREIVPKLLLSELKLILSQFKCCNKGKKGVLLNRTLRLLAGKRGRLAASSVIEMYSRRYISEDSTRSYEVVSHSSAMPRSTKYSLRTINYPPTYCEETPKQSPVYPISPDVVFRKLPFYKVLVELLKPSSLIPTCNQCMSQEKTFSFHLTPQQSNKVSYSCDMRTRTYSVQIQLRFCLVETSCEQDDKLPPGLSIKVNDSLVQLPPMIPVSKVGVVPKRQNSPIDITAQVWLTSTVTNSVSITWEQKMDIFYCVGIYLVEKMTSIDLVKQLREKGVRNPEHTKALIRERLEADGDCEISTTSLRVSLLCPLGKSIMQLPCRALTCSHLQCFDATLYLQMNEKRPTWTCPICDKLALYDNIFIDGYFSQILMSSYSNASSEIELQIDGSWSYLGPSNSISQKKCSSSDIPIEIIDDDDEDEDFEQKCTNKGLPEEKAIEVIDLLSDSDCDIDVDDDEAALEVYKDDAPVDLRKSPDMEVVSENDSEDGSDKSTPKITTPSDSPEGDRNVDREEAANSRSEPTTPASPVCILLSSPSPSPPYPPIVIPHVEPPESFLYPYESMFDKFPFMFEEPNLHH